MLKVYFPSSWWSPLRRGNRISRLLTWSVCPSTNELIPDEMVLPGWWKSGLSLCVGAGRGDGMGSLKGISCPGPFLFLLPGHYNLSNWFSPIFCRHAVLSLQGPQPWNMQWKLRYHEPRETSLPSVLQLTSFDTAVRVSAQADPVSALANFWGSDPGFVIGL